MGQGKNATVPSQSDAPEESELWTAWQLFPLDDDQTCHSNDGGSAHSDGQFWEEIAGAWRHVHISAWEFNGNIRSTNWTDDSEKFRCSRKLVLSLPRVRFLGHRLLTSKSPGLLDERFKYLSWLLLPYTSVRRENKYILLYILRLVVCLARAKCNIKKQTWCQWQGSENCSDEVAQRTVNRILYGKNACSLSKMKHGYWEKQSLCWEEGMGSIQYQLYFDVWYMFLRR